MQEQLYSLTPSTHDAPFSQGELWQSSMSGSTMPSKVSVTDTQGVLFPQMELWQLSISGIIGTGKVSLTATQTVPFSQGEL